VDGYEDSSDEKQSRVASFPGKERRMHQEINQYLLFINGVSSMIV
jgi:hypothetical protein